nr:hypothetical protein [Propionivibrio sp.]
PQRQGAVVFLTLQKNRSLSPFRPFEFATTDTAPPSPALVWRFKPIRLQLPKRLKALKPVVREN